MGVYVCVCVCVCTYEASQVAVVVKNPPVNAGNIRLGFNPWVEKIPWRRAWPPAPVFLPGESHGQRSLVGYSSRGHKESDTPEVTQHACVHMCVCMCVVCVYKMEECSRNRGHWFSEQRD